jgi:hypothetical protein
MITQPIKKVIGWIAAAILLALAGKEYFGYHFYYRYKEVRASARNIEGCFSRLERNLKTAVFFSKNPLYYKEIARLYMEMALAENEFGTEEKRDFYLDRAKEGLASLISRNPIDAFAYYEMGKVYMLYNFPLLTYMDRGRSYFRKALEFKPADEFLNLNITYIFLVQWDFLENGEKSFILERLKIMREASENFIPQLRKRWRENFGNEEKLEQILRIAN